VCALPDHRFQKHSDQLSVSQRSRRYTFCSLTRRVPVGTLRRR
jgi:hypothetical protein